MWCVVCVCARDVPPLQVGFYLCDVLTMLVCPVCNLCQELNELNSHVPPTRPYIVPFPPTRGDILLPWTAHDHTEVIDRTVLPLGPPPTPQEGALERYSAYHSPAYPQQLQPQQHYMAPYPMPPHPQPLYGAMYQSQLPTAPPPVQFPYLHTPDPHQ